MLLVLLPHPSKIFPHPQLGRNKTWHRQSSKINQLQSTLTQHTYETHTKPPTTMPPTAASKNKPPNTMDKEIDSPNSQTATQPNTRRTGTLTIPEDQQDIKDANEGRKFLEKHSLLCPPGEPTSHQSLLICLHQISTLSRSQKQMTNTIRAVAFLLDKLDEIQVNQRYKDGFDTQINEVTHDIQNLIQDIKEKISNHISQTTIPNSQQQFGSLKPQTKKDSAKSLTQTSNFMVGTSK